MAPIEGPAAWRRKALVVLFLAGCLGLVGAIAGTLLTQPGVKTWSAGPLPEPDPARLEASVRWLALEAVPRDFQHPEQLERVALELETRFRTCGARVESQPFAVKGRSYRNVIARFGPEGGAPVVVGAHYDAYRNLPGADDNASGVAGLLELARLLGQAPPSFPVELVAYTLEEPPNFRTATMGSAQHAQSLRAKGQPIRAMISLEMIGYFSDEPDSQHFPVPLVGSLYPSRGNFIAVIGRFADIGLTRKVKGAMRGVPGLDTRSMNAPRFITGVDFSDHHPYWDQGYPAVMVTDSAFFRNEAYHTAEDLPERLDYQRMAKVVQGVWCAVQRLGSK